MEVNLSNPDVTLNLHPGDIGLLSTKGSTVNKVDKNVRKMQNLEYNSNYMLIFILFTHYLLDLVRYR